VAGTCKEKIPSLLPQAPRAAERSAQKGHFEGKPAGAAQADTCRPDARWKAASRKIAVQQPVILNERRSRE